MNMYTQELVQYSRSIAELVRSLGGLDRRALPDDEVVEWAVSYYQVVIARVASHYADLGAALKRVSLAAAAVAELGQNAPRLFADDATSNLERPAV